MLKIRDFDLSLKAVADSGRFSGYASVFNVVDTYQEQVAPGAFTDTLAARKAAGRKLPILWQHQTDRPLGTYDTVKEDAKGLFVEGDLLPEVTQAREALALMKAGAVTGLSIGYWTRASSLDEATGIRTLTAVDLEEVSLVTFPANEEARIDAVKLKLAHGGLPTLPEFERLLRESGFSRTQAAVIATRGMKHLLGDPGVTANEPAATELLSRLRGFSLPKI